MRHWGQVKYLWSLSLLRARWLFRGFTIFVRNQAFSLRRLGRFLENIRNRVHTIRRKLAVARIVRAVSFLLRTISSAVSSSRTATKEAQPSESTPLRPYIKRENALPIFWKKLIV